MHGPTMARTWPDHDPWHPSVRRAYLSDFGDACHVLVQNVAPAISQKRLFLAPQVGWLKSLAPAARSDARQDKWSMSTKLHPATKSDAPLSPKCFFSVVLSFCDSFFLCTLQQHSSPTHWHHTLCPRPVGTDLCHDRAITEHYLTLTLHYSH